MKSTEVAINSGFLGQQCDEIQNWCLGPDLNRHGGHPPGDFKTSQAKLCPSVLFNHFIYFPMLTITYNFLQVGIDCRMVAHF